MSLDFGSQVYYDTLAKACEDGRLNTIEGVAEPATPDYGYILY